MESKGTKLGWYVLKAIGGRERKVGKAILSEIERLQLNAYIEQVLVPLEKVYQLRNGKKIVKEKVYFPGYVFVQAYLSPEITEFLRNIPDVLGFLNNEKGTPESLREAEVLRMLGKTDELREDMETPEIPYRVGDIVKVIDGPFNTFSGAVHEVDEDKKRLIVMVRIFERKTPLELSYMQVEKE